eukprot:tig00020563_g11298.t1
MHAYVRAGSRRLNAQAASAKFARAFTLPAFLGGRRSNLEPYTVLVTGCSSGIGQATALALLQAGFDVLAGVRKQADAERLQARTGASSSDAPRPRLRPILLDVTNEQHVRELPEKVGEAAAGRRVGIVNNAGVGWFGPLEMQPMSEIRHMFDVNVFGVISVTQALLPMIRSTRGRVVLVGSIRGFLSVDFSGGYAATKYAVEAIGDSLRRELRPFGVPVSIIEPAFTQSHMTDEQHVNDSYRKAVSRSGPYEESLRRNWTMCRQGMARAAPASLVAESVLQALTSPEPRDRYRVGAGFSAERAAWLARLPASIVDKILADDLQSFEPYEESTGTGEDGYSTK